ncbi:MAG: hypothetical protein KatS3mg053_3486 [Candidatus Roseilinea sp.]|nr:MAG: hypothetical protein KatS3mg053_3486 [Candidatus Roseilinea sp.]
MHLCRNFYARIAVKALALFAVFNVVLVFVDPMPLLARLSVYNWLVPGRQRLPFAEHPDREYSVTVSSLDVLFASHEIHGRPKTSGEYRIFVLGDSATWGWKLRPEETVVGAMNAHGLVTPQGRIARVYNLAYPMGSATRDLLLLDYAMRYQPDMVVWLVSFDTLSDGARANHPLVRDNAPRMHSLIARYRLRMNRDAVWEPARRERTLFGRRKPIADALRLQLYGLMWAATGIDHDYFSPYPPVQHDLKDGNLYYDMAPKILRDEDIAFDIVAAMHEVVGGRPLLIVNEPILIAQGKNSDVRYNDVYPRWLFDQYRALMTRKATQEGWHYLDVWDLIPPDRFTDTEFHINAAGNRTLARQIVAWMVKHKFIAADNSLMSNDITTALSTYIATHILKQPKRVIRPDEKLISSGLIDSFHLVDLGLFIEDKFGVRIDDSELNADTFDTLDQLAALIASRQ